MADRDINYRISTQVTGVDPVTKLQDALDELEDSVEALDGTTAAVDVDTAGVDEAGEAIGEVADDVEALDGATATVDVDEGTEVPKVRTTLDGINDILAELDGEQATVDVEADTADAAAALDDLRGKTQEEYLAELLIEARAQLDEVDDEIAALQDRVGDEDLIVRLEAQADLDALQEQRAAIEGEIEAIGEQGITLGEVDTAGVDEATTKLGGLATAVGNIPVIGPQLRDVVQSVQAIGNSAKQAGGFLTGIFAGAGAIGLITGAVNIATKAWGFFTRGAEEAKRRTEELLDVQEKINTALTAGNVTDAANEFVTAYGEILDAAEAAGVPIEESTRFITGLSDELPTLTSRVHEFSDAEQQALERARTGTGFTRAAREAQIELAEARGISTGELIKELTTTKEANKATEEQIAVVEDARAEWDLTNGSLAENQDRTTRAANAMSGLADDTDDAADAQEDLAAGFDEIDAAAAAARQAIAEYDAVVSSADWGAAALEGATRAYSDYFAEVGSRTGELIDQEEAWAGLGSAIESAEGPLLELGSSEGRQVYRALQQLGRSIVPDIARAFANSQGDIALFEREMNNLATRTLLRLQTEFDLTEDQAEALIAELGLIPEDIETFYKLAGDEEARIKLGLLQGVINSLPTEVQTEVAMHILADDPQAALASIQNYLDSTPAWVRMGLDASEVERQIRALLDRIRRLTFSIPLWIFGRPRTAATASSPAVLAAGDGVTARHTNGVTAAGALGATAPTLHVAFDTPPVVQPQINIRAGVIGNRYELYRTVSEATRGAIRFAGRRQVLTVGGRNP